MIRLLRVKVNKAAWPRLAHLAMVFVLNGIQAMDERWSSIPSSLKGSSDVEWQVSHRPHAEVILIQ